MRKFIAVLTVFILLTTACILTGCNNTATERDDKISIVTTIFPEYDWVKNILGDKADSTELIMLLDNGVDLHSYQPSVDDIVKISNCDLFIYVGGESDSWVEDALKNQKNPDRKVINLFDVLGDAVKEEEHIDGMEEHEHEDDHDEEKDEHVWLSICNAKIICNAIAEQLFLIDPDNKDVYAKNLHSYIESLSALDKDYRKAVDEGTRKTLLFGDRFPFRYLVSDYGLDYFAAFSGCSAETEASFETVTFLAGKVDELGLPYVLTTENAKHQIAQTIIQSTKSKNQKILTMDSMQSTTYADVKKGTTYISIMQKNLEALKTALR
mgnify:CR=1 FL=1